MKNKLKTIISIIIMLLMILFIKTESQAAENNEQTTEVKITPTINTITEGEKIPVELYIKNTSSKIEAIDVLVDFNSDIFNELDEDDFEANVPMTNFDYVKEDKNLQIILDTPINEGKIATIYLTPKKTIKNSTEKIKLLSLYDMYLVKEDGEDEEIPELNTAIWVIADDNLYLSSETYKIGDNDINNYEEGDKFISRVKAATTLEDYRNNLKTNGTIKVIKQDGTELGDEEFVGTGMTLQVTKDEEKIELQIAVTGDLDGNGKITATDLAAINQTVLGEVELENEYALAGDFDENKKFTATDLAQLNQLLLESI